MRVAFGRGVHAIPAAVLLLCLIAAPSAASAATPKCPAGFGGGPERATIVGTPGDDTLRGRPGRDVIAGLGGDDRILGLRRDHACGGRGDDLLKGRGAMMGGRGDDVIRSTLVGDFGEWGGRGNDRLYAFKRGPNDFVPGPGNDLVVGAAHASPNWLHFEHAKRPVTVSLAAGTARGQGSDTLRHIQNVGGGRFNDTLIGNDRSNDLDGRAGADKLIGRGGGFDFLHGRWGDDLIRGGRGDDASDYVNEGQTTAGPITVNLVAGTATGQGTDTLRDIEGANGSSKADTMIGDEGDNFFFELFGGNDTVDLGGGDDFVDAGPGADLVRGGQGTDAISMIGGKAHEQARRSGVTVDLSASTDSDGDTLSGFEDFGGSLADDTLTGDDGPNDIFGEDGNDTINGLGGNDRLVGGKGKDTIDGGAGSDRCRSGENVSNCEAAAYRSHASGSRYWQSMPLPSASSP